MYELRDEICPFLTEKLSPLTSSFSDEKCLLSLSYLADIFSVINESKTTRKGGQYFQTFRTNSSFPKITRTLAAATQILYAPDTDETH